MIIKKLQLFFLIFFITYCLSAQSYDFGKTRVFNKFNTALALPEETKNYLDALATYLHANESFKVKISGFSDNSGTSQENENLSLERVKMISDYLLSKGITEDRIEGKSEGARMAVAVNDSPENKALNNRVEIIIVHSISELPGKEFKHEHHSNHIALFGGATTFQETKETFATAGLECEHRFKDLNYLLGIGLFGEAVLADETEYVAGIPIFIHPYKGIKILFAPGVSILKDNIEMIIRAGIGYDIFIGKFAITPGFNIDYVKEHIVLVYGLSFGIGF
ncbi:MAG: OmpA family protein [Ignavibacteriae bacterium]|nr:OmpA family protein [Ignavibacteriota bacterium]